MSLLKKILNILSPEHNKENSASNDIIESVTETYNRSLTNNDILNEIVNHFTTAIEQESVGDRMIYPMSFNIMLHKDDYAQRKQYLEHILPEIVKELHKKIKQLSSRFPDITPISKRWTFQFSSCDMDSITTTDNQVLKIRKGQITTVAYLCSESNDDQLEFDSMMSVKLDNSNVFQGRDINPEAFKNIDIVNEGLFHLDFDRSLLGKATSSSTSNYTPYNSVLAVLTYPISNSLSKKYEMKDSLIHISGKNETRNDKSILKLDLEEIGSPHVTIKHIAETKTFQLAVFGNTRLNGRLLKVSEGGNINWYNLADNSQIFINEKINVLFKINK